jgi:SAM-dependent methyltransferase
MATGLEFDGVAEAYQKYRADYGDNLPALFVDCVLKDVRRGPTHLLELGSGTGIATEAVVRAFARRRRKFEIVTVEPGKNMLAVAQSVLSLYGEKGSVHYVQQKFEDVDENSLPGVPFHGVFVATAWNWLCHDDPAEAEALYERIHGLLRPAGRLAILQNVLAVSDGADNFYWASRPLWQKYAGERCPAEALLHADQIQRPERSRSNVFRVDDFGLEVRTHKLTSEQYLGRISTFARILSMEDGRRDEFFAGLTRLINGKFEGIAEVTDATTLLILQKV